MGTLRLLRHGAPPLEITQDRVLVGRDPSCDVVIDDKSVSRRHAFFERRGGGWGIVDQGSANGTFVNGAQISDADLYDGQELRLGMVPLRVEIESPVAGTVLMGGGMPVQGTVMMPSGGLPPMPPAAPYPPPQPMAPPMAAPHMPPPMPPAAHGGWGGAQPGYAQPQPAYEPSPQEEAAGLLGVHPQASPDDVRARYMDLAMDLQAKIDTARTPHLKTTYQRNLDELRKAAELLSPGFTTVDVADLPAAAPTVVPDEMDISLPQQVKLMGEKPPDAAEPTSGLPPFATTALGFISMALIAMSAYFALSSGKVNKAIGQKKADPSMTKEVAEAQKLKAVEELSTQSVLTNGKLKLCNKGTQTYELAWVGAVYQGPAPDTGVVGSRTFNTDYCRADFVGKFSIPPGGELPMAVKGSTERCVWNGDAVFYGVAFKHPQNPDQQIRISGTLHNRQDCVNIGEGW